MIPLLLRLALAAVFAMAGASKLADREGTRVAVRDFGVPAGAAGPVAIAVAVAELLIAAALLMPATALAGAVAALAMLAVFSAAIAANLARGRRPECHCFGQVHSEPIGRRTLLRNGALAVLAAVIAGLAVDDAGPSALAWVVSSPGVALGAGIAAGLGGAVWIAFELTRRHGAALRRVDELEGALRDAGIDVPEPTEPPKLPIGTPAPAFAGMAELLSGGRPVLLTFTSGGCGPCRELAPKLARWREDHSALLTFAELDFEEDRAVADRYGAEATPAAIVIGADGTVESTVAHGGDAIEDLVEGTVLESLPPPPDVGEPIADLTLETLAGERVGLRSALAPGRDTLMLFWNPGCGFCRAMRDDLRPLEEGEEARVPALLVVSTGNREEVRREEFRSPVLLDPLSVASASLGAGGTPTAVLVGADGNLRSEIAGGRDSVLELAGVVSAPALSVVPAGATNEEEDGPHDWPQMREGVAS